MEKKLEAGDVVRLKSGGPSMTVVKPRDKGPRNKHPDKPGDPDEDFDVLVTHIDGAGARHDHHFPAACLVLVPAVG